MNELEETRLVAVSLSKTRAAIVYKSTIGSILHKFISELDKYKNVWEQKLVQILPEVKSGTEAEVELMKLILDYQTSPFELNSANHFLTNRRRELETLELPIKNKVDGTTIEDSLNGNQCLFERPRFAVQYNLYVLPITNIVEEYINTFQNNSDNSIWSEKQKWFWNQGEVTNAGHIYEDFNDFRVWNKERKDTCYIVSLGSVSQKNEKHANIAVYRRGRLLDKNFAVPQKIVFLDTINISHNEIQFNVDYHKDTVTNTLKIIYWKKLDLQNNDTGPIKMQKTLPISDNGRTLIQIHNLEPNTYYAIIVSAGSDVGNGEPSDELLILTNVLAIPQSLKVERSSDTTIDVSWKMPQITSPANLTLNEYEIKYNGIKHSSPEVIKTGVLSEGQMKYTHKIENLEESTEYTLSVRFPNKLIQNLPGYKFTIVNDDVTIKATTKISTLNPPTILNTTSHTIALEWEPPTKSSIASNIQTYFIKYNRIEPTSGQPLISGTEKTLRSSEPWAVLEGLVAGATYTISIKVKTTSGTESLYSPPTISSTLLQLTELEKFRESLNIEAIESNIKGINTNVVLLASDIHSSIETLRDSDENLQNNIDACSSKLQSSIDSIESLENDGANALRRIKSLEKSTTTGFVAQSRSGGYIPIGPIKFTDIVKINGFKFQSIYGKEFYSLTTGRFVFSINCFIHEGTVAYVRLLVNGDIKASFWDAESDGNRRQLTGTSVVDVKEGDFVKITNERSSTLIVSATAPITVTATYISS